MLLQFNNDNRFISTSLINHFQGLCKEILGDTIGALVSFNVIRRTEEWSHEATRKMIHIYLRLDDFEYWSCLRIRPDSEAINAADMLLSNLENSLPNDREVSVLRGYWEMIALEGKFEKPLKRFSHLLEGDEVSIECALTMCCHYNVNYSTLLLVSKELHPRATG